MLGVLALSEASDGSARVAALAAGGAAAQELQQGADCSVSCACRAPCARAPATGLRYMYNVVHVRTTYVFYAPTLPVVRRSRSHCRPARLKQQEASRAEISA